MQKGNFIWGSLNKEYRVLTRRIDWIWTVLLLMAAVIVFTINLGGLPLHDWDEGTVAQVAREISRAPLGSLRWLFPTSVGGEQYHNKPPLMHILIAINYSLFGVSNLTTRLPGAILTAISVPLLYGIGREIFRKRKAAIYSALVYLTMLPVIRHGRMAMLDGAVVCFFMLMLLCVLRSRRDLRYCLGVGLGFGLICLTKGMLGVLLGVIAFVFLWWDTPRLLYSRYMWLGLFIGCTPIGLWYGAQLWRYGSNFTDVGIVDQSLSRIWLPFEGHSQPPWFYLLEIIKYTAPWLLFFPASLKFTWHNRNLSWAKLALIWSCVYLISISLMGTKLPWYVFPIYPSLALAVGAQLSEIDNLPLLSVYPRLWVRGLGLMSVIGIGGSIYFSVAKPPQPDLPLIFACIAGTMALSWILAERGDNQFLKVLLWGSYLSLLLLMKSNYWLWQLNEAYPVEPVAQMIRDANLGKSQVFTSFPYNRPSLNFYSDRTIVSTPVNQLKEQWQNNPQPYFLVKEPEIQQLQLTQVKIIAKVNDWTLVTKNEGKT
jgi:4-amino-4-deoxy-L-arabinose transferase-like glycosyltransferase